MRFSAQSRTRARPTGAESEGEGMEKQFLTRLRAAFEEPMPADAQ